MTYYGYDVGTDRVAVFKDPDCLKKWIVDVDPVGWRYEVSEKDFEDCFSFGIDRKLYDLIMDDDGTEYLVLGNTWNVFRAIDRVKPGTNQFDSDKFTSGVAEILGEGKSKYIVENLLLPAILKEAKYEIEESFWENPPSCDIETLKRIFDVLETNIDTIIVESILKYTENLFKELLKLKSSESA